MTGLPGGVVFFKTTMACAEGRAGVALVVGLSFGAGAFPSALATRRPSLQTQCHHLSGSLGRSPPHCTTGLSVPAPSATAIITAATDNLVEVRWRLPCGEVGVQEFSHAPLGFSQVTSVFELADQQNWQPPVFWLGISELF